MDKNKEVLVRFNVQNIKFAFKKEDGEYDTPTPYGSAKKMALQSNSATKDIYGDGKRICSIVNEKNKTGVMTTNNVNDNYEIAVGRKIKTGVGLADIKQRYALEHAIYFETCGVKEDGNVPVAKTWLYGVTSTERPAETFDQTTEDINESSFDTALKMAGVPLKTAEGKVYKDKNGNDVLVWQLTVVPGDKDYETFGNSVVLPIMEQATEVQAALPVVEE